MRSLKLTVGGIDLVALIRSHDGEDMVAVKPISEALGLDWAGQYKKISNDLERLNCRHMSIVAEDGKQREMLCIPIKKVAIWLCSINPKKVKEKYKATVIAFQEELQHVLYSYVKGDLTFEKIDMLLKTIEGLREDHAELRADYAELRIENAELRAENAELRTNGAEIERRLERIENGADEMASHYASASAHGMLAAKARKRHLHITRN